MQTRFDQTRLQDPDFAESEGIIRKCVHCGFCTATCPTYVLLGDELDSPRGRIYLIKEMLETEAKPTAEVVKHIDRCLSCLACVTTCPSGVNYAHLIDHGRAYVEEHYQRPWVERFWRWIIAAVLPDRKRFAWALRLAPLARPLAPYLSKVPGFQPAAAMLALAPKKAPERQQQPPQARGARGRVILLQGCAEAVLSPEIRAASVRLLQRMGFEVVEIAKEGCCGSLVHHMGRAEVAKEACRRNLRAWGEELRKGDVAGIISTASGCGVMLKDYGFLFRDDPVYGPDAKLVSKLANDIAEFAERAGLPRPAPHPRLSVAYHSACSLQHGQQITATPQKLLRDAGFDVRDVPEGHLCCGSAGTYNLLQSAIAARLLQRKLDNIDSTGAEVVAAGNIGCLTQIASGSDRPVIHTVELLDWATGGPTPLALRGRLAG